MHETNSPRMRYNILYIYIYTYMYILMHILIHAKITIIPYTQSIN